MSETWHQAIVEDAFPDDDKLATVINGWHVLVVRIDGGFHAMNDRCTHAASSLSGGRIRRGAVMCPLHGARFELKSGKCLGGAYADLRTFPTKVEDGALMVCVPDEKPTMAELPFDAPG